MNPKHVKWIACWGFWIGYNLSNVFHYAIAGKDSRVEWSLIMLAGAVLMLVARWSNPE